MIPGERPGAIDTRLVLRVYWLLGTIGGLAATAMGVWFLSTARTLPTGASATAFGIIGVLNWSFGLSARALAQSEDPLGRLRGLRTFALAHLVVGAFLWVLDASFQDAWERLGPEALPPFNTTPAAAFFAWLPYRLIAAAVFSTGLVLAYLAYTASPASRFAVTMQTVGSTDEGPHRTRAVRERAAPGTMQRLRSQFEEQIRQATRREERARLARDLHDAVKQQLFVIQTAAATTQARLEADPPGARDALAQVRTAAREALTEMDAMLDRLQGAPIENVGLVEALKKQCEALEFSTGATVTLAADTLPPSHLLPPGAQQAIFRVAQEALSNVRRHARAQRVSVRLQAGADAVSLTVADDGSGFDPIDSAQRGMGLRNMQARAQEIDGRLDLASGAGAGTTITFTVPLSAHAPRRYVMTAAAFGVALAAAAFLWSAYPDTIPRIWLVAGGAIAGIGAIRNAVAWLQVRRAAAVTP